MKRLSIYCAIILLFFFGSSAYAEKLRGNAVPRQSLPSELKSFDVVDYYVPLKKVKPIGRLQSMRGTAIVIHKNKKQAYFAQKRDKLYKGDQ